MPRLAWFDCAQFNHFVYWAFQKNKMSRFIGKAHAIPSESLYMVEPYFVGIGLMTTARILHH